MNRYPNPPPRILNKLLRKGGYLIERSTPAILKNDARFNVDLDFLIKHELYRCGGKLNFIQIGANDGVSRLNDLFRYIRAFNISGILVEPQPDIYSQLKNNFSEYPNLKLVNKAVHKNKRSMTLYRFNPELLKKKKELPVWAMTNGMASFNRNHVLELAGRIDIGEDAIEQLAVECITLVELFEMNPIQPEILKVDTEGYDYETLEMLDLDKYRPTIIHFEHLYMTADQYTSLIHKLINLGYRFIADKKDTTAYLLKN